MSLLLQLLFVFDGAIVISVLTYDSEDLIYNNEILNY